MGGGGGGGGGDPAVVGTAGEAGSRKAEDETLLYSQDSHRSSDTRRGRNLCGASHMRGLDDWQPTDPRVSTLLRRAGFNVVRKCTWVKLDRSLLTALVDRWRPETNTFHFPHGEMTITLQDVSCILGLHVDGDPVVATQMVPGRWRSYSDMCNELLGVEPEDVQVLGQSRSCLQLKWLREKFANMVLRGQNIQTIRCYTRAYIMYFLGKALLPDTSGNEIHMHYLPFLEDFNACGRLSWGSAVLAYLYRQLSSAALKKNRKWIGGCLHLLQLWCWERFHIGRPIPIPPLQPREHPCFGARWHRQLPLKAPNCTWEFYRNEFDMVEESQITWEPYCLIDLSRVAAICRDSPQIWRAHVPMLCMSVMEVHMPERVWRQFGASQNIPPAPDKYDRVDGRGHAGVNWLSYHAASVAKWNERESYIQKPPVDQGIHDSGWRQWYEQHSNLYLTPFDQEPPVEYCPRGPIERALVNLTYRTRELLTSKPNSMYLDVKKDILQLQEDTLQKLRMRVPEYVEPPHVEENNEDHNDAQPLPKRAKGLGRRNRVVTRRRR